MERNIPSLTGQDWHQKICFGCGVDNPHGLHADFRFDEESGEVHFEYTANEHFSGPPGYVHGGILATLLDEAQGVLCFHIGHVVLTDQLLMNYHKATPLQTQLFVRCWIRAVRKRRLYTSATIKGSHGELLVSSRARWYVIPERMLTRMFRDQMSAEELERTQLVLEANRKRARAIRKRLRMQRDEKSGADR